MESPAARSHTWSAETLCKSETSPADHVCHPATSEVHWGSVQVPKREHHHPCLHRRHQTPTRRRKLPGSTIGNQPTGGDLAAPRGCLASCAKNQRAGRCPTYSKSAIIRPSVAGYNLMKTKPESTFLPSWNSSGSRTLVNTASEGGVVPQGSRSRHRPTTTTAFRPLPCGHNPLSLSITAHCAKVFPFSSKPCN